jgi:hypothetical protein
VGGSDSWLAGMNLRWLRLTILAVFALHVPLPLSAEEAPKIVSQRKIGEMACGPCSLLNALKFGGKAEREAVEDIDGEDDDARVKTLIEEYGRGPSDIYPDRARYREKGGMADLELLGMVNELLRDAELPPVIGRALDRTKVEAPGTHLRQVHKTLRRSLDAGFPPIVILRSFVIKPAEKPKKGEDSYVWWGQSGHWVAVVDLPEELEDGELSFVMKVADPWTGRTQQCFIHEEQFRNFTAAKGDDRKWVWPTVPQPYLIATMPALALGTKDSPWFLRTNVVLSFGIYRK